MPEHVHPLLDAILADLEPTGEGPAMSDDRHAHWVIELLRAQKPDVLGSQLIEAAIHLRRAGAVLAVEQLVLLVAELLGAAGDELLAKSGFERKARPRVAPAQPTRGLNDALAPPRRPNKR
jgi:hypothetical protein